MPPLDTLMSPQAQQAIIAGLFLAVGWVVVAWQNRRRDLANREERVRDVQGALHAEIQVYTETLESQVLPLYGAQIEGQILAQPGFFPVIPTEKNDRIYNAIVDEIHVLPFDVVRPVVKYYYQLSVIAEMASDLRALDIHTISADRAARMYRHYIEMKIEAIERGNRALEFLGAYLEGGNRAVDEMNARNEKARLEQSKAGLQSWISDERQKFGEPISSGHSPAAGRSGRS